MSGIQRSEILSEARADHTRSGLGALCRCFRETVVRSQEYRAILYEVWYCAIASTARVSVLLGCRSSSRIVK